MDSPAGPHAGSRVFTPFACPRSLIRRHVYSQYFASYIRFKAPDCATLAIWFPPLENFFDLISQRRTRAYCIRMHQVDFVLNLLYGNHRTLWPGAEKKRRMVLFVYFRHFRLGKKYSLTCKDVPHGYDTSISHIRASVILDGFVEYVEQK